MDIKTTKNVHFSVFRSWGVDRFKYGAVIPFDCDYGCSDALDESSGIFTAPVDGIYHLEYFLYTFDFIAVGRRISIYSHETQLINGLVHTFSRPLSYSVSQGSYANYVDLKAGTQVFIGISSEGPDVEMSGITFSGCLVEEHLKLD